MSGPARNFVVAATLIIAALIAIPLAPATEGRPFHAEIEGNANLIFGDDPCRFENHETGAGNATHLGNFTWADVEDVNRCTVPGGVAVKASFIMTAANGDELHGTFTSIGLFDSAGNLIIHGEYQFGGGTGRFVAATGAGDIDAIGFFAPGLPVIGTFDGTIEY